MDRRDFVAATAGVLVAHFFPFFAGPGTVTGGSGGSSGIGGGFAI